MIQSVERAIAILNLFKNSRNPLGLAEMAKSLNLAKTTVHTIIKTLEKNGFLHKDPNIRKYKLGFSLFELGALQAANLEINQRAFRWLQRISNETGLLCRVGIWDSGTVLVTMNVQPQGNESLTRQFGPRLPGYCTALGKAILAHMPDSTVSSYLDEVELTAYTANTITGRQELLDELARTKSRGYSISNGEILMHQGGIGAPVRSYSGDVAGAVSMRLNPEDLNDDLIENTSSKLLRTTHNISLDLGYQPLEVKPLSKKN